MADPTAAPSQTRRRAAPRPEGGDGHGPAPEPRIRSQSRHDAWQRTGPHPARVLLLVPSATWALLDMVVIAGATYLAYRLLVFGNAAYQWVVNPWLAGAAFCACISVSGMVFGLYERKTLQARSRILARTSTTLALGVTLAYACLSLFLYAEASRWVGLFVVAGYLCVAVPLRIAAHHVISAHRIRLLCVGCGDSIRRTVALLCRGERSHFQIVGHICTPPCPSPGSAPDAESSRFIPHGKHGEAAAWQQVCPRLGSIAEIERVLKREAVDEVVVASELASEPAVDKAVLAALKARRRVIDQPTFIEEVLGEVPAAHITAQWFLLADVQRTGGYEAAKRIVDVTAAVLGLVLTLPLWPLVALAIRLDSRGPAIFQQERVGIHGRRFRMYKFRTMRMGAEAAGACWAAVHDTRITRVGRLLRRTRLDELPQLWNILRGDMALVGPRPERPEFVDVLARRIPHYEQRHLIKPGLTGWAQIHYPYGASIEDAHRKLCYDLYYLKHRALDVDLAIIIRTIGTFIVGAR